MITTLLAFGLLAQTQIPPSFEVASVRRIVHAPGSINTFESQISPDGLIMRNVPLGYCIR
jgi:hypothetical protein